MRIFIIADLFFLVISIMLAIHFVLEDNSPLYHGFIMMAYLLVRQGYNDTVGD